MELPDPEFARAFARVAAFVFGANVGSFLNVVAHRLPLGLSVVRPRSRCPACRTPIAGWDNIPVLSWILLGGRCRGCKGWISAFYPAVELATGLLALHLVSALALSAGAAPGARGWLHAVAAFAVTAALLAAALLDAVRRILPDAITKPGM